MAEIKKSRVKLSMNARAQLKIQQMAFMLMAVFIFFILAGMFYLLFQSQDWRKKAEQEERNNAIGLANMLSGSAEFTCGDYCIDADRAMVLRKRQAYASLWKVNSIKTRTVSNKTKDTICTEANYPDCNEIVVYKKGNEETTVYSYVSLCKRVKEKEYVEYKCELAKFIVGYAGK